MKNEGNAGTEFRGRVPVSERDYLLRFMTDNFIIKLGQIVDVYSGGYVAQVTFGSGSFQAIWLSNILNGLAGTSEFTIPPLGTKVLVMKTEGGPNIILGCVPSKFLKHGHMFPVDPTGINYHTQKQHNQLTKNNKNEVDYYPDDRPNDALPGDMGWINEFGNVLALLRGMVLLKATQTSQIQLHTLDQLVRIVSRNFEHLCEGREEHIYNDQGNLSSETEIYTTQEESRGTTGEIAEDDPDTLLKLKDDLERYIRVLIHNGHVGSGSHIYAREGASEDAIHASEIHVDTDGSLTARSTRGIKFQKAARISWPKRTRKYYQAQGDKEYEDVAEFSYSDGDKSVQEREKEAWDALERSKRGYHSDDWEKESYAAPGLSQDLPQESTIHQRDDGSVLIQDRSGSSIELDGSGNIIMTCQGNIEMRTGKDHVVMAGNNSVMRARNHVEIVTTEGTMKIKTEDNMQIISRRRGITIETESSGFTDEEPTGIMLKTNNNVPIILNSAGHVSIWGKDIVADATQTCKLDSREIFLSAGNEKTTFSLTRNLILAKADDLYWDIDDNFLVKNKKFTVIADRFHLSGATLGYIHGGGERGTIINHTHAYGADEFRYARDCLLGGRMLYFIRSENRPIPDEEIRELDFFPSVDELTTPFVKTAIDKIKFKYEAYDTPFSKDMVEFEWQRLRATSQWDLTKDEIEQTQPFPGKDYSRFFTYTRNFDPLVDTPKAQGGEFSESPLSTYRV